MGLPNIGPVELIIVLVIALLVLGPGKLPEVGSAFGKTIREFKKASSDITDSTSLHDRTRNPGGAGRRSGRRRPSTEHPDPGHRPEHPVGRVRAGPQGHARRPGLLTAPERATASSVTQIVAVTRAWPASTHVDVHG